MPPLSRLLAATSQATRSAAKKPLCLPRWRTVVAASLEDARWVYLREKSIRVATRKSVIQAVSGDAREASYILALANQGLSAESACRMEFRFPARGSAAYPP
ncbi:hypothetical protein T484DRAFT_1749530 [Baffinella frigidus]|nr:hypothetical protein T484DRAFT_1749530 [Cryptophyta sp. CCMP2293]